jgi:hypothetical protein
MLSFAQAENPTNETSSTQFMDRFSKMPANIQRVIIGVVFLVIIVGIVILKDMIATEEETKLSEDSV